MSSGKSTSSPIHKQPNHHHKQRKLHNSNNNNNDIFTQQSTPSTLNNNCMNQNHPILDFKTWIKLLNQNWNFIELSSKGGKQETESVKNCIRYRQWLCEWVFSYDGCFLPSASSHPDSPFDRDLRIVSPFPKNPNSNLPICLPASTLLFLFTIWSLKFQSFCLHNFRLIWVK